MSQVQWRSKWWQLYVLLMFMYPFFFPSILTSGMQRLVHFWEGVWESLRRLSGISWMAEQSHKVAEYYLPHKSVSSERCYLEILRHLILDYSLYWWKRRISCVHTQVLEAGQTLSGPVNDYKGLLWSGHFNGSIKVWDIKRANGNTHLGA